MIFTIEGEPKGKQRPRFNSKTHSTYTPTETRAYEKRVKYGYVMAGGKIIEDAVKLEVWAFCKIPTSICKKRAQAMTGTPATKKPDVDNILKIIQDGLTGVAYADDKQVTEVVLHKNYWPEAKVVIDVTEA